MAAQSGGTARIASRAGQGTRVTLEFPFVSDRVTPVSPPAPEAPLRGSAFTVLLAEDDDGTRHVVARMLRQAGYVVVSAVDGSDALRLIESGVVAFDVLLTDIMMPGLTGTALAERLRAIHPHVPVLYMTGYSDTVLTPENGDHPVPAVIAKPFSVNAITARIAELLRTASTS
jgi:CheY-like chemotaxis protein